MKKFHPPLFRAPLAAAVCLAAATFSFAQSSSSSAPTPPTDDPRTQPSPSTRPPDTNATTAPRPSDTNDHLKWGDKRFVKKVAEGGQLEIAMAELALEQASSPEVRTFAQQIVTDHRKMSEQLDQLAVKKDLQPDIAEYSVKMSPAGLALVNSGSANASGSGAGSPAATARSSEASTANKPVSNPDRNNAGAVSASTSEYDRGLAARDHSSATIASSSTKKDHHAGSSGMESRAMTQPDGSDWNDPTTNRHYKNLAAKSGAEFDKEYISMMVADHEDDVAMFEKESKKGDDTDVRAFAQAALPKLREHLSRAQQIKGTIKS